MDSPVDGLPPEIICQIFRTCAQNDGNITKLQVSQVCRRWRQFAIGDASLWKDILILPHRDMSEDLFANLLRWLDLQFERSGSILLDVEWSLECGQRYNDRVIDLVKRKAPFHRWRSLSITTSHSRAGGFGYFAPRSYATITAQTLENVDGFLSLESLRIMQFPGEPFLDLLNKTTTPRLRVLDISQLYAGITSSTFDPILRRISSLALTIRDSPLTGRSLPPNILQLRVGVKISHPYPHLLDYRVSHCRFVEPYPPDLRSLVSLTVAFALIVGDGCAVELPNLRHISCERLNLALRAAIDAPLLESLTFMSRTGGRDAMAETRFENTFSSPGYHLSPKQSLVVDHCLSITALITLLQVSSRTLSVSIRFPTVEYAYAAIERLSNATPDEAICPSLKELRLIFEWRKDEIEASKKILTLLKKGAHTAAGGLDIYGCWKGEGVFERMV